MREACICFLAGDLTFYGPRFDMGRLTLITAWIGEHMQDASRVAVYPDLAIAFTANQVRGADPGIDL